MKYALIIDDVVDSIALEIPGVFEEQTILEKDVEVKISVFIPDDRFVEVSNDVYAGYIFSEGEYRAPDISLISIDDIRADMKSLTARQFRLALIQAGMLSSIQAAIDTLEEPIKSWVETEWEYSTNFDRTHPMVIGLSAQVGLTPEQVDTMWIWAATI